MLKDKIFENRKMNRIASILYSVFGCNKVHRMGKVNRISYKNAYLHRCRIVVNGRNNSIDIGYGCHLNSCCITVNGSNNQIRIGNRVSASRLCIIVDDDRNIVNIGDHTIISGDTHLACIEGTNIYIGADCLFSANITVRTGDSHSIVNNFGQRINPSSGVRIGTHIWIGNTVTILKGVSIASDCVIGTGSVVTQSVDVSGSIVAGNPAVVRRKGINWDINRIPMK